MAKTKSRWGVLAVFAAAAGLSQLLWLNFAPLVSLIETRYHVSESQAGLLLLVFPLIYMLLSIHAGNCVDKRGYRSTVGFGTLLMAGFSCLRVIDGGFWLLFVAQLGIAVAQPYVVNGISKLVLDWFEADEAALANGIGTMGMFIGMAVGMAATPPLVESVGFQGSMVVFAAISVLVCVAFYLFGKENPARPDTSSVQSMVSGMAEIMSLLKSRQLVVLFSLAFLGLGFFNGLTTWIEPILAPNGMNSTQAGVAGGILVIGGIFGAVVVPGLSDSFKRHKPFLIASIAIALATIYPLCNSSDYTRLLIFSAVQGFFFLPAFALLLAMCSEIAGEKKAGAATGLLMLAGNGGGVAVILAMEWLSQPGTKRPFDPAVTLLAVSLAGALICSIFAVETHPSRKVIKP